MLTLVVGHNGPVELSIKCKGKATGRLTEWTPARIEVPSVRPYMPVRCSMKPNFSITRISELAVLMLIIMAIRATKARVRGNGHEPFGFHP